MKYLIQLIVRLAPMHFLIASVSAMGWGISFETDFDLVEGLVIGTDDYIDRHTKDCE